MGLYSVSNMPGKDTHKMEKSDSILRILTLNFKGKSEFQVFSHSFHNGSITGVDICQRKPLVVTCGTDRSIKIWNYMTLELELSKEFEETVESVALHPTGKGKNSNNNLIKSVPLRQSFLFVQ